MVSALGPPPHRQIGDLIENGVLVHPQFGLGAALPFFSVQENNTKQHTHCFPMLVFFVSSKWTLFDFNSRNTIKTGILALIEF